MGFLTESKAIGLTAAQTKVGVDLATTGLPISGGPGILATVGPHGTALQLPDALPTPGNLVLVKIASAASGSGAYNGHILSSPPATINATSDVTDATFGSTDEEVLIVNSAESGLSSSHRLTAATVVVDIYPGVILASSVSDSGLRVVAIFGIDVVTCEGGS